MPAYDWTKVDGAVFHAFQNGWIAHLQKALNNGVLPLDFYTLAEQRTGDVECDTAFYLAKRRTLLIRHVTGDRVVALIEIVSPGNSQSRAGVEAFVQKAVGALMAGVHLLVVDLFPPRSLTPSGMHGAILDALSGVPYSPPDDAPLTLASYRAAETAHVWIEPVAVGLQLPDMPLCLSVERYVNIPLEVTCEAAVRGLPARFRERVSV